MPPAIPSVMKAAVIEQPGPPEVLRILERPVPAPMNGWVLIRVRAFGINRSELFTRQGHSPGVEFPRILGIEAVGEVAAAPAGEFSAGDVVATAMGGMGRQFDGSYAQYTLVPSSHVQRVETELDWARLAALPEMLQTAWGSLETALRVEPGQTLLIRGGTTSIGLAAAALAKDKGLTVLSTSRKPERESMLRQQGADHVVIDDGEIAPKVRELLPRGVDRVLELVGTVTLLDSLQAAAQGGVVCMTGIVGNRWDLERFAPMEAIPTGVYLTAYAGEVEDFMRTPLTELLAKYEEGRLPIRTGPVFGLDDIVEAHRTMEENRAGGKIVVRVE